MQMTFKEFVRRVQTFAVTIPEFIQSTSVMINRDDSVDTLTGWIGVETNRGSRIQVPVRAVGNEIFIVIEEDTNVVVPMDTKGLYGFLFNHFEQEFIKHTEFRKR